jgi:molybdate-binding protein/DNA-binding XRE family transcriptional regulator
MDVHNQLSAVRSSRGISAASLAGKAGVSRQTIYAIEAGSYVPNTAVALRLAQILDVRVEELFHLEPEAEPQSARCEVDLLSVEETLREGQPLQLSRIGKRMVGVYSPPLSLGLPPSDAIVARVKAAARASVELLSDAKELDQRVLIGGCDPGISVLARHLTRAAGFEIVIAGCSSLQALRWLKEKKLHVAGSHLCDEAAGISNLRAIRRFFPRGGCTVVAFAGWEEGLVVAAGNRKRIRSIDDLARKDVTLVNRERGAGSRFLLDRSLQKLGVQPSRVRGYGEIAHGHIPAAWHVYSGKADCCIATRAAARVFGLEFVPLVSERFDLVIPKRYADLPAIQALLDTLNRATLRRQLRELGGYDTSLTGKVIN